MAVYFITGKLGGGKSLAAVGRLKTYLEKGKKVATNLDLFLDKLLPHHSNSTVIRIPDKPRLIDLQGIGFGSNDSSIYNEENFGALVLDELGTWMNTRAFADKERAPVIDWFLHARKMHWDVFLIVQDVNAVDKQLRDALCEHLVTCKRTDRYGVPFISPVYKIITGKKLPMPRIHMAAVRYGSKETSQIVDRWWYRGTDIQEGYNTGQCFTNDILISQHGELVDMRAPYSILSAYHLRGRYLKATNNLFLKFFKILFYPLVALSQRRSKLGHGQPLLSDISTKSKNYCSYLVNTVCTGDKPEKFNYVPNMGFVSVASD